MDGEKDPHCLMLVFHIIPALVGLFPNPSGSLASFPGDLFEVLGCYFPIHFTHVRNFLSQLLLPCNFLSLFFPVFFGMLVYKIVGPSDRTPACSENHRRIIEEKRGKEREESNSCMI